jgi:hypothetical protein
VHIIPGILLSNLVGLTTSSRRQCKVLSKRNELGAFATSDSLGKLLKKLLAGLLTATDLIDAIDNDDAAVRSLERALQCFNQSGPEMFFICLGVGGSTGLVVGVDKRVVPVREKER